MQLNLANKSVLVTGSSRGIGRAIAESFLAEQSKVAFNGRDPIQLEQTVSDIRHNNAIAVAGDASKPAQAQATLEKVLKAFGRLDILVCNVGGGRSVPPGQESYDEWQRVFELNLWSATTMIETCRQALAETQGVIVCISSICGQEVVPGAPVTYSAAKAALNAYVRGSARPLGELGVRINAIAPGNILFEESVWNRKLNEDIKAVEDILKRDVSLAKFGSPQDVANLALWLASPAAGFTTGSIFVTDGGQVRS
ncbi:SDR family NAD(P)-dependent oxidoreductase [Laribacter hongkongensis]|uniref:SDR family NAD(P)-dependent oxidoreductase n=1 Tax=Laribacter hongkongensis TaxID=168471 RepID=UPI000484D1DA|nr:SDR family NAD(P)-dependent oxidoreductase [Laribacter hongkongensis]